MSKKLWIARDSDYITYDYPNDDYGQKHKGKLHIFYDTPELELKEDNPTKYWGCSRRYCWGCAREIAIVPSYMYPEIEPCTCWQLDNLIKYKDEHFMNYEIIGDA